MENPQLLKVPHLKKIFALFVITILLLAYGCNFYGGIKGTVVDNASGKPIEGAVVVAQWTKEHGMGDVTHTLHKITETLTDKEGNFSLTGTIGFLLQPPEMIVYKDGYIPWRNDMGYPGGRDIYRKNKEWNNHQTYGLDKFTGVGKDIIALSDFTSHSFMIQGLRNAQKLDKHISLLQDAKFEEMKKMRKDENIH